MSEDREDIKKTLINEAENAEEVRAPEETRIYNARATSGHTWIGEDPVRETRVVSHSAGGRETRTAAAGERSTRVAGQITDDRETRIAGRPDKTKVFRNSASQGREEEVSRKDRLNAAAGKAAEAGSRIVGAGKQGVSDLRKVRVADKKKFSRFLKIVGVFVIVLALELGYFGFASHVKKMPKEIKETQKELELTQEENKLLEEEIEALGDYDSGEELKASWERLMDKVDKAAAGTYY